MCERVQFAHMKFGGEVQGVNAGALKISGECVEFAARIGKMPLSQLGNNDTAAFDADFKSLKLGGGVAQRIVGLIEGVEDARI